MTTSFVNSWDSAERGCLEYLQGALGTLEGVHGFTFDKFPREMPENTDGWFTWTFKISGGPIEIQRQARTEIPGGVWHMNAEFFAACSTDKTAKQVAGTVIGALPVLTADVAGVSRLYATDYPIRDRALRNLFNNENAGQETVVFEVRIPMKIAFENIAEKI